MAYDGIVMRAVAEELEEFIGGKINKIYQPAPLDLEMILYHKGQTKRLLISASPNHPRMHFVKKGRKNPLEAPSFVMFLRRHLQNATVLDIRQIKMDRIIEIKVQSYDELGFELTKSLMIEIMGKHSNIILIDENNKILDSIKRVTETMSRVRQVLPGLDYVILEDDKINILTKNTLPSEFIKDLDPYKTFRLFFRNYTGFSPLISKEIVYQAGIDLESNVNELTEEEIQNLDRAFQDVRKKIRKNEFTPEVLLDAHKYSDFHVLDIEFLGEEKVSFSSISELLEIYFRTKSTSDRISQKVQSLKKTLEVKLNRDRRKLETMKEDFKNSKNREEYKIFGDLLSVNAHKIQKSMTEIEVENFLEDDEKVMIPLDPKLNPWDNVESFYHRHRRLKSTEEHLRIQIPRLREEIKYLEQLESTIGKVTEDEEVEEIRQEMVDAKLIRSQKKQRRKKKVSKPYQYESRNGVPIFVGKNNRQNDELTMKRANREDYFFHAKDIPGSHVILRDENITEEDIQDAAFLAAYYSSAGEGERQVEVDFTKKKNVFKGRGAKPGMVYYENFETLLVSLDRRIEDFKEIE